MKQNLLGGLELARVRESGMVVERTDCCSQHKEWGKVIW